MKTQSTFAAGLITLLTIVFSASQAQSTNPAIKVLPTKNDGIVKLLVVGTEDESVDVKFYNNDGLAGSDAIKSTTNGFNKKYDVRQLMNDDSFSMEVKTAGTIVTYRLTRSKGRLIPYLVNTTYNYPVVASKD